MEPKSDPLDREVALRAELEQNGVSLGARSRTISALDRLFGGAVGIPAAYLHRWHQFIEASTDAQLAIQQAEHEAALKKLREEPDFGDRVMGNFLRKQVRQQYNREKIGGKTLEYMLESRDRFDEKEENINEDWLNFFEEHAQNASTEQLQDLWARVLAGEIREPGAFSRSTIRFIAELDEKIAKTFQEIVFNRLPTGLILHPENLSGKILSDYYFLEEVGLLQHVGGTVHHACKKHHDGYFYYQFDDLLLKILSSKSNEIKIPVARLTRTGREIAKILPKESDHRIARLLADRVSKHCSEITIHKITARHEDGSAELNLMEKLL